MGALLIRVCGVVTSYGGVVDDVEGRKAAGVMKVFGLQPFPSLSAALKLGHYLKQPQFLTPLV
jgi:hypothetical protein